jgi:CheY-like chemotaxis protein
VSAEPANKTSVLVIDDEVQIRRLLRVSLEAHGYRVFEASTGKEGITEAAQRHPDVVLLDLGLPDLDGVTVLKRLREWSSVPVVWCYRCATAKKTKSPRSITARMITYEAIFWANFWPCVSCTSRSQYRRLYLSFRRFGDGLTARVGE